MPDESMMQEKRGVRMRDDPDLTVGNQPLTSWTFRCYKPETSGSEKHRILSLANGEVFTYNIECASSAVAKCAISLVGRAGDS